MKNTERGPDVNRGGFEGKVALVTGAAQGIGEAVARALGEQGAHVAVVDVNADHLGALAADLSAKGRRAGAYAADVRDKSAVEAAVERVEAEMGPIGALVNVAGVLRMGPVVEMTDDDWKFVFDVNTHGVFYVSRAVAKRMAARRSGAIVTVASNAAGVPRMHMSAYASSKAATVMFTKCLGLELAAHGIRCNVVSPGSTDTPMQRSMWTDDSSPRRVIEGSLETFKVGIPLRKLAQPSDVANAVLFLLSDGAGHITMQDLYVDGGAALT
ncbi:MAG TPA: 2,3-dihydro-2,3-dihydroxybenzoate dehydrogenase [Kofleriaceae bacterium]